MKKLIYSILGLVVVALVVAGYFVLTAGVPGEEMPLNTEVMPEYDIKVSNLDIISSIASPLTIQGEARGSYFENNSFPIELKDEAGTVIGKGTARTTADTSTDEYIPFTATITFSPQEHNTQGQLIFLKANSSGDTSRSYEYSIPVRF
jgi:hypothetical protein